jgi:hypothetical protein
MKPMYGYTCTPKQFEQIRNEAMRAPNTSTAYTAYVSQGPSGD